MHRDHSSHRLSDMKSRLCVVFGNADPNSSQIFFIRVVSLLSLLLSFAELALGFYFFEPLSYLGGGTWWSFSVIVISGKHGYSSTQNLVLTTNDSQFPINEHLIP